MIYYVSAGNHAGRGTKEEPFGTIRQAADIALPGDEVIVLPGIYREAVDPRHAGTKEAPIVYRSSEKGGAVITGAEQITGWEKVPGEDGVWKVCVPNSLFTDRNPFTTPVSGDWFIIYYPAHTGDVFLNGKSLYEVTDYEKVAHPVTYAPSWDPEFTLYTWYTAQDEEKDMTILYANFHEYDPNTENVEISVRKSCFYPEQEGISYITLSGFTICQAATQWAPPTAYQEGMVGPHWSKGWIIEDCELFESKCSGISLGKYYQPYDQNRWSEKKFKDGAQTQRDVVLAAWREGWSGDRVGSHIVRRCHIHDCGQTGICGFMGGIFSLIEDNHIHHINNKQNLAGAEIAGIKMHAAIDVIFRRNHIHHCTRGMWLDWQAQGTRVTQNLMHDNTVPFPHLRTAQADNVLGEDIWLEVSHGPTLIDNNLLLSTRSMRISAQGAALVHNLIAGSFAAVGRGTDNGAPNVPSPRYTPYHLPHSTDIAGFMTFLHGDMRFYHNIFVQQEKDPYLESRIEELKNDQWDDGNLTCGISIYDDYPTRTEWEAMFEGYCGEGSVRTDRYYLPLPVWAEGNLYFNGAKPWKKETDAIEDRENTITLQVVSEDGKWRLATNLYDHLPDLKLPALGTEDLGEAFEPEARFENPDGTPIRFDTDYHGASAKKRIPGPFII